MPRELKTIRLDEDVMDGSWGETMATVPSVPSPEIQVRDSLLRVPGMKRVEMDRDPMRGDYQLHLQFDQMLIAEMVTAGTFEQFVKEEFQKQIDGQFGGNFATICIRDMDGSDGELVIRVHDMEFDTDPENGRMTIIFKRASKLKMSGDFAKIDTDVESHPIDVMHSEVSAMIARASRGELDAEGFTKLQQTSDLLVRCLRKESDQIEKEVKGVMGTFLKTNRK